MFTLSDAWGAWGRRFKSSRPDQLKKPGILSQAFLISGDKEDFPPNQPADPSSGGEASIRRCAKPSQGFPYALFYVYGVN